MASSSTTPGVSSYNSPPKQPTAYGSFLFPTPSIESGGSIVDARREADLAQRERELKERERLLLSNGTRTVLGFEFGDLRHIGRPLWRDVPLQFQHVSRRLYQLWWLSTILFSFNWLCEVGLSLESGGNEYAVDTGATDIDDLVDSVSTPSSSSAGVELPSHSAIMLPNATSSSSSSAVPPAARLLRQLMHGGTHPVVGGQVGVATLLLLSVPIGSWLGWCHPLLEAALSHGTSDRTGWCALLALGVHVLLCGLAALGPPGCGLAGFFVAWRAPGWLAFACLLNALGFAIATFGGLEVYRRTLRSQLVTRPSSQPPPMPPANRATASGQPTYGRI